MDIHYIILVVVLCWCRLTLIYINTMLHTHRCTVAQQLFYYNMKIHAQIMKPMIVQSSTVRPPSVLCDSIIYKHDWQQFLLPVKSETQVNWKRLMQSQVATLHLSFVTGSTAQSKLPLLIASSSICKPRWHLCTQDTSIADKTQYKVVYSQNNSLL